MSRKQSEESRKRLSAAMRAKWDEIDRLAHHLGVDRGEARTLYEFHLSGGTLETIMKDVPEDIDPSRCPKCNSAMTLRNGPTGPFMGCVGYPDCKTTRPYKESQDSKPTEESVKKANDGFQRALQFVTDCGGLLAAQKWLALATKALE